MAVVEDPGGASATETALLAQILVTPKHGGGSGDEVAVAFGSATVREHGRVFEAGADAVSAGNGAEVDRPRRDAVAMVDLFTDTPASASACSIAAACSTAVSGSASRGSTIARMQREAMPVATKRCASSSDSSPSSMPIPRVTRSSHSSTMPPSPWLAVTKSGSSVQASTSASRRLGSGTTSAEVLNELGIRSLVS